MAGELLPIGKLRQTSCRPGEMYRPLQMCVINAVRSGVFVWDKECGRWVIWWMSPSEGGELWTAETASLSLTTDASMQGRGQPRVTGQPMDIGCRTKQKPTFNLLSPHYALKHHFTSLYTDFNFPTTSGFSDENFLGTVLPIHGNFLSFFTHEVSIPS